MYKRNTNISKLLSWVLRHQPEKIGLTLDEAGWVSVADLLRACNAHGLAQSSAELQVVVATNDKARFTFNADGAQIRANQGHSIPVTLGYEPLAPPEYLVHGTATRFLAAIQTQGLVRGHRHHVHLSADKVTAHRVGRRHGRPVILQVHSGAMHRDGFEFYRSANGVWLVEAVPAPYLEAVADDD